MASSTQVNCCCKRKTFCYKSKSENAAKIVWNLFVPSKTSTIGFCWLVLTQKIGKTSSSRNIAKSWILSRGTQRQFSEDICSKDDLRSIVFETFVVKFLACLPLLGFADI